MQITIEENVPVPASKGGPNSRYPFPQMKVGDSFALELDGVRDGAGDQRVAARVRSAAAIYGRRQSVRFITRINRDENVVRCWRVA